MLTMRQKMAVTGELRDRYQKSKKREKITILNEFTKLTGYNRSYASQILNQSKLLGYVHVAGQTIKYIR
ncbi:MAG TPA: transposase, partial [Atribacterota bacterium]|nr:transposase [Atribacterota bacterium]